MRLAAMTRRAMTLATQLATVAASCIGDGQNDTAISDALNQGGPGAIVELCPGAVIPIYNTVTFSADGQVVQTQGLPTDSTRALLRITVLPDVGTPPAIFDMCSPSEFGPQDDTWQNVGLRNLILDGNRQTPGNPLPYPLPEGFDRTVVMGAGAGGQFIDQVELRNDRGSGCIYMEPPVYDGEDGNGSLNPSITNSVFRNCTTGISLDGINTLIANNEFYLDSSFGIEVIYNGLQTNITNNTFSAMGAPNVAPAGIAFGRTLGSAATLLNGTSITKNHFSASGYMSAGILLGTDLGTSTKPSELYGPLDVTGNTFSGKISFPIAIDTYYGPINITQNDISGLVSPVSAFTNSSACSSTLQDLANGNHRLVLSNLTGDVTLQSDFYNASGPALSSFFCFGPDTETGTGSDVPLVAPPLL